MSEARVVLVTGATGNQGGAVVRALLARGHLVLAMTRDPRSEAALGLAVGTYAGWAVVKAAISAGKSLGPVAVTAVSVPPAQLIVALVVGVCAGILAVLRPARRAGRLNVLAAMANE